MIGPDPKSIWGNLYQEIDTDEERPGGMYCRLSSKATDKQKEDFEDYVLSECGGFLIDYFPEMEDPYFTWEGKIVERSSLKGRKIPLVPREVYE